VEALNFRKTTIIALVFLLLAGGYYYFEVRLHSEKAKAERQKKLIFPFHEDEVDEIHILRKKDSVRLKKERDKWEILDPIRADADVTFVNGLIKTLLKAEIERIVDSDPDDLEPFGLNSPGLVLEIRSRGKEPFHLLLGERSPTEVFYYAKTGKDRKVFLVFDRIRNELEQPLFAFREKGFVRIDPEKVTRINIQYRGKKFLIEKDREGHWKVVAPILTRGDDEEIRRFLYRIRDARIKDFIDLPRVDLSSFGLDPPLATVTISSSHDTTSEGQRREKNSYTQGVLIQKKCAFSMKKS